MQPPPMPRLILRRRDRTHALVWLAAILCALFAIALIFTGIVVFAIYMMYQPKTPHFKIAYVHLNKLAYNQSGLLDIEIAVTIMAENDNAKAHVRFSNVDFTLSFHGIPIAKLRAAPCDVSKNSSLPLSYMVKSSGIPLDQGGMDAMDTALKLDQVPFELTGHARTRWRMGVFVTLKLWSHLSCQLQFFRSNGSSRGLSCSSRSP